MYKLIIVDDESIILRGLTETFDWLKMGFEIIATAQSGEDALVLVERLRPDVLITDIRMKRMDGLELIKKCQTLSDKTNYVVISAYKEFDYARSACILGVYSYLLKPLDEEQVFETMFNLKQLLDNDSKRKTLFDRYIKFINEEKNTFETQLLERFLTQEDSADIFQQKLKTIESRLDKNSHHIVVCLSIDFNSTVLHAVDENSQLFILAQSISKRMQDSWPIWYFKLPDSRMILVFQCFKDKHNVQALEIELTFAEAYLKMNFTAAISTPQKGFHGLKKAYEEALNIYEADSDTGVSVLKAQQSSPQNTRIIDYPQKNEYEIIHSIRQNDSHHFYTVYNKFNAAVSDCGNLDQIRLSYQRLALSLQYYLLTTYGLNAALIQAFSEYISSINRMRLSDQKDILAKLVEQSINQRVIDKQSTTQYQANQYIEEAREYILNNLENEEISINDVSNYLHLNPVYFGRVFKNTTGASFREYLSRERLNRAIELLNTNELSIIVIAQMVGFKNPSYFSQLFKQYTGLLPSEYKGSKC